MTRTPVSMFRTAALASFVTLLAACGGGNDPASSSQVADKEDAVATEDAGLPWVLDPTQLSDSALVVNRRDCDAERYAAEVRWSLRPAHGSQPQIWLRSGDSEPKLWVAPSQREGAKAGEQIGRDAGVAHAVAIALAVGSFVIYNTLTITLALFVLAVWLAQRSVRGEVISSTFDEPASRHVHDTTSRVHPAFSTARRESCLV